MKDKIRVLYAEDDPRDADLTQTHFQLEAPEFEVEGIKGVRSLILTLK